MNLEELKKQLEREFLITKWNPTDSQLQEIAYKISLLKEPICKQDVNKIILEVHGSIECIVLEGMDNSDLSTLLLLATNNTNND